MNLQEVAGGKKFLKLLLEAVNFTGYHLIMRTLPTILISAQSASPLTSSVFQNMDRYAAITAVKNQPIIAEDNYCAS